MRLGLLIGVCGILTSVLQNWVGAHTIYAQGNEARRQEIHSAIIENRLPAGQATWADFGAKGMNVRVIVVFLAEGMHRALGITVNRAYRLIDSVGMFATFLLLFGYLRHWFDEKDSLIGVLFVAFASILTYFLFWFHPWDRLGLAAWIVLLFLIRARRPVLLGLALILAMAIKYDVMLVPALYGLYTYGDTDRGKWLLTTGALFAVTVGTFGGLLALRPGGFTGEPPWMVAPRLQGFSAVELLVHRVTFMLKTNLADLRTLNVAHTTTLMFVLPVALAIPRLFSRDRFVWSSALFALAMFVPYVAFAHIVEVRTMLPMLILLLPAALLTLRDILERSPCFEHGRPSAP